MNNIAIVEAKSERSSRCCLNRVGSELADDQFGALAQGGPNTTIVKTAGHLRSSDAQRPGRAVILAIEYDFWPGQPLAHPTPTVAIRPGGVVGLMTPTPFRGWPAASVEA